ncbi:MAG: hypothetical protein ACK53L_30055, partial [Pirellulaceae bacterium]
MGSTLKKQHSFSHLYRSTDIQTISGGEFDLVVCAGAPAQKWIANQQPENDLACIETLMGALGTIRVQRFVLISTVDVFMVPVAVDETSSVDIDGLHPYGAHRRKLETFVEERFENHLIVRLPGLVGPGLRKNIIYDILHNNDPHKVDRRATFQFYPMVNLWFDLQSALLAGHPLVHLTAEPISVAEVSEGGFGQPFEHEIENKTPPTYDFQTIHASAYGGHGSY